MAEKEVKLKINDEQLKGAYANQVGIMHTRDEFVLDFISMLPPEALVVSRVIVSPAALKRMYTAIGINIKKFEESFGTIKSDDMPLSNISDKVN
ncbi:MAG: DUF3467 domain-containing protein [Spirochaetales bacterium]|nr:DUF3467 domain-containing protein [Spirochaetales bacterium]